MGLLTPLALLGLLAVAIPVIVHLTQRDRKEEVPFPSLMFLERIPYRAVRRQRIRNWALFLLRLGAVSLLVAAFARPFFAADPPALPGVTGPVDRVVLLDRSMSMSGADLWDRGVQAARDALRSTPAGGRSALLLFDDRPMVAAPLSSDPALALAVLDTASATHRTTRLGPALQAAASILDDLDRRREITLISDLQASAWPEGGRYRLPEDVSLSAVSVEDRPRRNRRLEGLRVLTQPSPEGDGPTRLSVSALLLEPGEDPVVVSLELDGEEVGSVAVTPDGRMSVPVTVEAEFPAETTFPRGILRVPAQGAGGLTADDALHFIAAPPPAISVLVVDDDEDQETSLFLTRALSVGTAPSFQAEVVSPDRLRTDLLRGVDVLILNDASPPDARLIDAFLEAGGGVLAVAGADAGNGWDGLGLAPGPISPPFDLGGERGAVLVEVSLDHPVMETFREEGSGDFSRARFFRARPVSVQDTSAVVVASFQGGVPALIEIPREAGRLLLWTSTLDDFWTDLPRHAVYLPFVHQMVRYAAGYRDPEPARSVGAPLALFGSTGEPGDEPGRGGALDSDILARLGGSVESVELSSPSGGSTVLSPGSGPGDLSEIGFHRLSAGNATAYVAVNAPREESDLTAVDPEAFVRQAGGGGTDGASQAAGVVTFTSEDREARQNLWRLLLVVVLGLLIIETALTARSRARVT
jgi:hypothetical protein